MSSGGEPGGGNSRADDRLHRLAASGDAEGLRRALASTPGAPDLYRHWPPLEDIIVRHGLKGTPLHAAAAAGEGECARLLVEHGADPARKVIQSERGDEEIAYADAAWLARSRGHRRLAEMLAAVEQHHQGAGGAAEKT